MQRFGACIIITAAGLAAAVYQAAIQSMACISSVIAALKRARRCCSHHSREPEVPHCSIRGVTQEDLGVPPCASPGLSVIQGDLGVPPCASLGLSVTQGVQGVPPCAFLSLSLLRVVEVFEVPHCASRSLSDLCP